MGGAGSGRPPSPETLVKRFTEQNRPSSVPSNALVLPNLSGVKKELQRGYASTDDLTEGSSNLYDKIVTITSGGSIEVSGTYPNFTISGGGTLTSPGGNNQEVQFNDNGTFSGGNTVRISGGNLYVSGSNYIPNLLWVDSVNNAVSFGSITTGALLNCNPDVIPTTTTSSGGVAGANAANMFGQQGQATAMTGQAILAGGTGGNFDFRAGQGGATAAAASFASVGGAGGHLYTIAGLGGAVLGAGGALGGVGGAGGELLLESGTGGNSPTSNPTGPNTGGAGGVLNIIGGDGGSASNGGTGNTGGAGGVITIKSGQAGTGATANGAAGYTRIQTETAAGSTQEVIRFEDGHAYMRRDNDKLYFGAGNDCSVYYTGSNMVINPKDVGTGLLSLQGTFNLTNQSQPSTPSSSGTIFVSGGALYYIGSSGTVTQIATA